MPKHKFNRGFYDMARTSATPKKSNTKKPKPKQKQTKVAALKAKKPTTGKRGTF